MKKILLALMVLTIILSACNKKASDPPFDAVKQAAIDDLAIQAYINAHSITAIKDPSGLYYQIITQGTGANANVNSTITANYTGSLTDGSVFDASKSPYVFTLNSVISGWQIGVPFVKAGGKILLLIPSGLGYGNSAAGSIPPSSVLIFTIDVLKVQ